jgi:hypothetical protein
MRKIEKQAQLGNGSLNTTIPEPSLSNVTCSTVGTDWSGVFYVVYNKNTQGVSFTVWRQVRISPL